MTEQLLLPVEGQRDVAFPGGRITLASRIYTIRAHNGRDYRFDWHTHLGPTFLKKDGEPLEIYPSERHPVWPAFGLWQGQGSLVDQDGRCIWRDADPKAVELTKPRETATELTLRRIEALTKVSMLPGCWDKSFIRGMASFLARPIVMLTEKQQRNVARLARKYRRQIAPDLVPADGEWL